MDGAHEILVDHTIEVSLIINYFIDDVIYQGMSIKIIINKV